MEDRLQSLEELLPTLATKQDIATLSGSVEKLSQDVGQLSQDVGQLSQDVGQLKTDVAQHSIDMERVSNNVEKLEHRFFQWMMTSMVVGSAFAAAILATLIAISLG